MARNRGGLGTILLAGAAAFAYYKYSQMSEEQKRNLVNNIKERGKKLYEEYIPKEIKDHFEKKQPDPAQNGQTPA